MRLAFHLPPYHAMLGNIKESRDDARYIIVSACVGPDLLHISSPEVHVFRHGTHGISQ